MNKISSLTATKTQILTIESTLIKAQATAGALFFIFLVLHLSNTLLAAFGPEVYNIYQRSIRQIYQHPVIELVLVTGPLVTHVISGVCLYRLRKKWQLKPCLRARIHTWSGFFLLTVVFGHMFATRGVSYWYGAFAEFEGVSFSLWWMPGYFYPYYFLLFMAGLYHGTVGAATLLKRAGFAQVANAKSMLFIVQTLGAIGVCFALLGFGGVLSEIHDPRDNDYARQYSELLNIDLSTPRN